jgi:hypothetical protein
MDPKGEIVPLALFDLTRIGQQQLLDGLCLTLLRDHPHK